MPWKFHQYLKPFWNLEYTLHTSIHKKQYTKNNTNKQNVTNADNMFIPKAAESGKTIYSQPVINHKEKKKELDAVFIWEGTMFAVCCLGVWIIHQLTPWEMSPTGHWLPISLSAGCAPLIQSEVVYAQVTCKAERTCKP